MSNSAAIKEYERKKQRLTAEMRNIVDLRSQGETVAIGGKTSSNLFRYRDRDAVRKIDMGDFTSAIYIDAANKVAHVEGMITYEDLVAETLKHGLLPAVVPELKSITVGGAIAGIGIESSSFKRGFVHETVSELEILLGDGSTVVCSPDNEHRDLFYGFANSYGTLGYALRATVDLVPAKNFVKLAHRTYSDPQAYFNDLRRACSSRADFVDGVVFAKDKLVLTVGTFVDEASQASDYTYMGVYYRSLLEKGADHLTASDYIWRWDPDWFWCSKHFYMQNPVVRALFGKFCLKSTVYWKIKAFLRKTGYFAVSEKLFGRKESVVQDVEIPVENAAMFLDFFHERIGITPIWVCPVAQQGGERYSLYPMDEGRLYVNFGFWDVVRTDKVDGFYNRLIELKVMELEGKKSLYSTSFYPEEEFWRLYDRDSYDALKAKYDPAGRFRDLYEKCVKRK